MMKIGSEKWRNMIYEGAKSLGIRIDSREIEKFSIHALELIKWNRKINLTAITDPMEVAVKHFLDSMAPVPDISPNASLLDIGSGGGFPGIPIKICLPSVPVTLIDGSRKKVNFLKHMIRTLGLENIYAFHIRAEDFAENPVTVRHFNVIISRALSSMTAFVRTAIPFLHKDGVIIAMSGNISDHDIHMLRSTVNKRRCGANNENTERFELQVKRYALPYLNSDRSLVYLKKLKAQG
ncbi:MAG: 16S rRNA (guanine(527)-N(7))-methyltransferase RsmG [Desulfobacterales bacterium]